MNGDYNRAEYRDVVQNYKLHNMTLLEPKYQNAKIPMKTSCDICGHIWNICKSNVDNGKGCPRCAKNNYHSGIRANKENNFLASFPKISEEWDYEKNNKLPSEITSHSGKSYWWICPLCNESYPATANNRSNGKNCPFCSSSKGEKKIKEFLDKYAIEYICHRGFDDCRDAKKLPFDFIISDFNLCIEFQGKQHYVPVNFGKTNKELAIQSFQYVKLHDEIKKSYCAEKGINFLEIPYWEIDNVEKILIDVLNIKDNLA